MPLRTAEVKDEHGVACTLDAQGDLSELLQHEIDHLDGVLAVQRAMTPTAFCIRAEWKRRYR
jgi:peptide deformylase